MDTNLVRYNVKILEANPFIKKLRENNQKNLTRYHFSLHHHHHHHSHSQNKTFYPNSSTNLDSNTANKRKTVRKVILLYFLFNK